MSLLQRLLKRPTKQFPERLVQRPLRESSVLAGLAGQLGQGFDNGIHLDFANDFHYIKRPGQDPQIAPFTSLFTFTGDNLSMYRGKNGLLRASVTNTPRIEYDVNGKCLGLLIEGARTNLILQSQDFSTTWTNINSTETVNAITAPDGTLTADALVEDGTAASAHAISQNIATAGNTQTLSVFLKAGNRTWAALQLGNGSAALAYFNLSNGTIGTTDGSTTARIQAFANGWYRCSVSGVVGVNTNLIIYAAEADNDVIFNGLSQVSIYIWGAQLENAVTFPSSYIPTTTVSVTRAADIAERTFGTEYNGDISGTVFAEYTTSLAVTLNTCGIFARDANGRWLYTTSGGPDVNIFDGTQANGASGVHSANITYKAISSFDSTGKAITLNGTTPTTGTFDGTMGAGTVVVLGQIGSGSSPLFGHIRRLDYWPERKPNSELQRLTS